MRFRSSHGSAFLALVALMSGGFLFAAAAEPLVFPAPAAQAVRLVPATAEQPAEPADSGVEKAVVAFFGGNLDAAPAGEPVTILAFGDVMLSRNVHALMEKYGEEYPFAFMKPVLPLADVTVLNLEGPVTARNNQPNNRMAFHFDPSRPVMLKNLGVDLVDLANNHGYDQGPKGAADTGNNLKAAGLAFFGNVHSESAEHLAFLEVRGKKIAFAGFQDVTRRIDLDAAVKTVKEAAAKSDYVMVSAHWGAEYVHAPNARQRGMARAFIDAGADAVVSHHPHVVQTVELYGGKPIFYSLGNFVFDQYFSTDTQQGLGVLIALDREETRYHLLPLKSVKSQASPMTAGERAALLGKIAGWSGSDLRERIEGGVITVK